ncbi:chromosome segregation protein [Thermococcus guaymasensis DSM 11113]|uniref:DNA double-strand break repair Rad50 ATPase n=1 Tax=Thermococcus guaymasensis DSM 11113 TaxID=1432656 RepID=A0A0X1KID5_9EURY|nr:DNA double-strand break repair ATPase Rad50 [Thermococcus guaymasensis]AJC71031.1 chromosome segregation protein [Thermococcus guaymasensis DSM 11113]
MRVRKIEIRNFRAHRKSVVEFADGINLIVGQNGAGKSSILEAIFASLYLGHPSFPKGYLKANARVGSGELSLTLEFEHNGKSYRITRTSQKNELLEDGRPIAEKSSDIARWVERNVYPLQVYTNALYIRQGEIEGIITNREIMEKVLRKVLGIEDYENAERNAMDVMRELRRRKESLKKLIEREVEVKENLRDAEKRFAETLRRISELRGRERALSGEVEELARRYREMKEKKDLIATLEKRAALLEKSLASERKLLGEHEKRIEELGEELKELGGKLKRLDELRPLAEEYVELGRLLKLKDELSRIEVQKSALMEKLRSLEKEISKKVELGKKLDELKKLEAETRKEYERLKERHRLYQHALTLLGEVERYRKELERAGYTVEKLEKELDEVGNSREELEMLREEISKVRERIASLSGKKTELEANMERLEGAKVCPLCRRPIDEHEEGEILEEYRAEIERIDTEITELKRKLEKMGEREAELKRLLAREPRLIRLKKTADLLREAEDKLNELGLEELERDAELFDETREKLIGLKKEIRSVRERIEELKNLEKEKKDVEASLSAIEEKKGELMKRLSDRGFQSFEEVEERLKELEKPYREFLSLKDVPKRAAAIEKKLAFERKKVEEAKNRIAELEEELEKAQKELEETRKGFSEEDFERAEKEYMEKSKSLERTRAELEGTEKLRDEITRLIEELKGNLKEIEKAESELELVEKALADMAAFREKVARLKTEEELRGLEEVQKLAGEMFSEMTEGKYQGIKLRREKKYGKEKIELKVLYAGNEVGIDFLSGGERIALGLAFRLALSLYKVGNLELLILDEPTPFLDEERRKKLVEIISGQLRRIPQVIIVSHDEELKDAADYVIRVTNAGEAKVEVESLGAY